MEGLLKMKRLYSNCLFFNRHFDFLITFFSIAIAVLFIIILFICFFVKFEFSTSYNGIVSEDDYNVILYVKDNELQNIKNHVLVVNKARLDYEIVKISDQYMLSDSGPVRGVYLNFLINDDDKIVNNVLQLNFICRKTIFDYIKEMIF